MEPERIAEILETEHLPKFGHRGDPCVKCGEPVPCEFRELATLATEATRLQAEVERYKGLWLRGSERHAHAIRAQHEHNQTIIRELTGGQDGTNDD